MNVGSFKFEALFEEHFVVARDLPQTSNTRFGFDDFFIVFTHVGFFVEHVWAIPHQ